MRRARPRLCILSLACLLGLTGCGSHGPTGGARSPSAAVMTYLDGVGSGNGEEACGVLTPALQDRVVKLARSQGTNVSSCAALYAMVRSHLTATERARFLHARITTVTQRADRATVSVNGAADQPILTRTSGRWYIAGGVGF